MTIGNEEHLNAGGCDVAVRRSGDGATTLVLHGCDGHLFSGAFLEHLAQQVEVVAPILPGWREDGRARHVGSVDDLSFVVLDLLDQLGGNGPIHLVGCSFGAWVAAEAATRSPASVRSLSLVAPLGIKTGERTDRAFVDVYASSVEEVRAALYSDERNAPNLVALDAEGFRQLAMAQEAVARFGWEPYLHNPKLIHRLGRLTMPCLVVGGSDDRFVLEPDSAQRWGRAIGDHAVVEVLDGVGHRVEEEAPETLADVIGEFIGSAGVEPADNARGELVSTPPTRGA